MKIFPIIPIWLMLIISIILLIPNLKNIKKNWIDILIVILLFTVNLRIMYPKNNGITTQNNLDVLFVIDNTISMNAEDYQDSKTRLSAVKKDSKHIIEELNGSRFSLITFNNTSKIITPFTKDTNITSEAIEIIKPIENMDAKGSSLNTPLENILTQLKSSEKKGNRKKIIFFISDGEITDNSKLESYKELKKYVTDGAVLGYGTTKGGYMRETNILNNKKEYIMDTSGLKYEKAKSKIDEKNLKQIAKDVGIDYIKMTNTKNINNKLENIKKKTTQELISNNKKNYNDTYFLCIIPLLILLIIKFKTIRGTLL